MVKQAFFRGQQVVAERKPAFERILRYLLRSEVAVHEPPGTATGWTRSKKLLATKGIAASKKLLGG